MSYLEYFNLKREPFSNAPDRRFFFRNEQHERALARLEYCVSHHRGLALCTGPIGHGKTTLARRLYDLLPEQEYHKSLLVVIHSDITSDWLLLKFAKLLGVTQPKRTKVEVLGQIYMRLRHIDKAGRKAVIMIDEAQMLGSRELMEEFRGLLNIELKGRKLINFVFFGLPEIEQNLKLDEPLLQRVAVRVKLTSYSADDSRKYIHHRMQVAGGSAHTFGSEVIKRIHAYTKGTPRLINTICDNLLLEGYLDKQPMIDLAMVDEQAQSFNLTLELTPKHSSMIAGLADDLHFDFGKAAEESALAAERILRGQEPDSVDKLLEMLKD
jgi:type II secretory pathway predicted ATPase ExeA